MWGEAQESAFSMPRQGLDAGGLWNTFEKRKSREQQNLLSFQKSKGRSQMVMWLLQIFTVTNGRFGFGTQVLSLFLKKVAYGSPFGLWESLNFQQDFKFPKVTPFMHIPSALPFFLSLSPVFEYAWPTKWRE